MNPLKKSVIRGIFMIGLMLAFSGASLYAWIQNKLPPAVGEIQVGEILYQLSLDSPYLVETTLGHLLYIEWKEDLILDQADAFNDVASSITMQVTIEEDSMPVRVLFDLPTLSSIPGLFYLIIIEGVNITEPIEYTEDYRPLIDSLLLTNDSTYNETITALESYNQATIDLIASWILEELDVLTIQIVFFGDYQGLLNPSQYLTKIHTFPITVEIVQPEKE